MEKNKIEFDDLKIKFLLCNKKLLIQSDDSNPQFLYYNIFDISILKICFQDDIFFVGNYLRFLIFWELIIYYNMKDVFYS